MKRHGRSLGVLVAISLGLPAYGDIDASLSRSVVQVQAFAKDGRVSMGSGVVTYPGTVATNCHVTRSARAVAVRKGGESVLATSQRADVERDLCLLEAPVTGWTVAKLGRATRLSVGETLYLFGYPRALGLAFSQGRVQSLHPFKGGLIIECSADLMEGTSGGGLFNATGHLIGLATFFSAGHSGRNYAIPVEWIADLSQKRSRKIGMLEGTPFWQNGSRLPKFLRPPGR